jgi:hypothetical protein
MSRTEIPRVYMERIFMSKPSKWRPCFPPICGERPVPIASDFDFDGARVGAEGLAALAVAAIGLSSLPALDRRCRSRGGASAAPPSPP